MKWKEKINKKYMQISLYVIITIIIIYALTLVIKNAPDVLNTIFVKFNRAITILKPIILGFVFAYLMDPVVDFFEKKYKKLKNVRIMKRIVAPRTWAAVTSVFILFVAITGLISLLVFTVTDQIKLASLDDIVKLAQEYKTNFNAFYKTIKAQLNQLDIQSEEFDQYFQKAATFILDLLQGYGTAILNSITNISKYLTTLIFSFIIGFYFMIDGRMFMNYFVKVSRALFSDSINKRFYSITHDLDTVFSGYIRGQLADALVMMVLISTVLSITGVNFAIVIGICAGIGNLIPYFGPIVAYISTTFVCLMNGEIDTLIVSMIALVLIQAIDGNIIGPKLLSRSIQIHPLIIIVSIIIGSSLGGFLGMLLAVPVGAYIKLVFVRFINHRLEYKEAVQQSKEKELAKNKLNINKLH